MRLELQQYGAYLQKWAWLLILGTILTGGVAYGGQYLSPPTYAASSSAVVGSLNASRSTPLTREQDVIAALTPIITGDAVLLPVAQKYPPLTVTQLRQDLSLSVPNMHNVLTFVPIVVMTVRSTSASDAVTLANGIANSFTRYEIDQLSSDGYIRLQAMQNTQTQLTTQISKITAELQTATNAIPSDPATIQTFQNELDQLQTQAAVLNSKITVLQDQLRTDEYNIHITQTAQYTTLTNRDITNALIGALIGFVAALGLAVLFEFTTGRVDRFATVEHQGVMAFAALPRLELRSPLTAQLKMRAQQSIEQLRQQMDVAVKDTPGAIVLIAGVGSARADIVSLLLCREYNDAGERVLLIDANEKPLLSAPLGLPSEPGLADVLLHLSANAQVDGLPIHSIAQLPNVGFIARGGDLIAAMQIVSKTTFERLKRALAHYRPTITIITVNGLPSNSAITFLAMASDGTLLVVDAQHGRIGEFRSGLKSLRKRQIPIYGATLYNMLDLTGNYGMW
jgi:capsular polysaccharide biosynthesis protein